jgi:hypothetical protein
MEGVVMLKYGIHLLVFGAASLTVIPEALAERLTCEQGSEAVCEGFCTLEGGGMSSNPDGTTTCTASLKVSPNQKFDPKTVDDKDWMIVRHPDKPPKKP